MMPNEYYNDLKEKFFSVEIAEKFLEGIEYIVSSLSGEELVNENMHYCAAYAAHNEDISRFFTIDSYNHDSKLIKRFSDSYVSLLAHFVKLPDAAKNNYEFKCKVIILLNSIVDYDHSKQLALELASKLIKLNLPPEFCLTVITRTDVSVGLESQQQFMEILQKLYGKHAIWDNAETPRYMLSITPTTPPNTAQLLHAGASLYCSQHAGAANLVFLFYVQSCWFAAGNLGGCNLIDHCLPFAVGALSLNKERCPEWRWVLQSLEQYSKDSMEQRWRSKIVAELNKQYCNHPSLLKELGINQNYSWMSFFQPFAYCCNEDYEEPISRRSSISLHYS